MNTGSIYNDLTGKIGRVRRKEHGLALQSAIITALAAAITLWTLAISIEAVAELDVAGRTQLYWGTIALSALAAAWLIGPRFGRYLGLFGMQDDDTIARRVGHRIPEVGDHLVNTLQLYRTTRSGALVAGYSPELIEASIAVQGEPLRHYDYSVIIEDDERKRALLFFLASVIVMGGLFLAMPTAYGNALNRLTHYRQEFQKPAPFTLQIAPANRQLMRGDSVEIVVRATGIPPRTVHLMLQSGTSAEEAIELRSDSTGAFRYTIGSIKATTTFYASSGPVRTEPHTLTVVERPELKTLHVTITSPGYTGRGTERLPDNVGDVSGIRGATVNVQLSTNIAVAHATIVQIFPRGGSLLASAALAVPTSFDTVRIPMAVSGTAISGAFRLSRDGQYYISVVSPEGIANVSPVHYSISVSSDGPPSIALVEPTGQVDVNEKMLLPTEVRISDDYGFSRLQIKWRLTASKYASPMKDFRTQTIPIPRGSSHDLDVPYIWDMSHLDMVPEDEVELYFEVYDNDAVAGPKVARTSVVKVRFPSLDEVLTQATTAQNQASADLEKLLKDAQQSKREMEEMNRELMKQMAQNKQSAGWQEKQKMQEMMKQQEAMQQKLEQVAENLRAVAEKLQEAKAISPETLQKYQDLQKLFQQMKDPALMEQMKKMQEQMDKMTPQEMAEAMKNYKFNEEQFRKSIERTMNILKRMQTEQKVDEMVRRADELQKQQEKLNDQMKNADAADKAQQQQLAEHQKQLEEQAKKMKEEARDLAKQMGEQEDMPSREMQDAEQSLQQDDPQEPMEQAAQQMEQGDMQQAQQQGEKAKQSAQNFQKKMEGVRKKMQESSQKAVANKMKKAMQDLVELSKKEEELKNKTEQTQPNSQQFRDQAREQQQLEEQMENLTNQMMSLGQKSFAVTPEMGKELGDAMREMQGATQQLEQRNGSGASEKEGEAMGSMNRAAKMMGDAMAQMEGGKGQGQGMGMGMQQRLQQMAAQQQMINQAMQGQQPGGQEGEGQEGKEGKEGKNGKDGKGNGSGEGKEGKDGKEMQRLSNQQGQVKKSLEDLNKEMRESGGTRKNIAGDLERTAKEIEEVLADMQNGQVTPQTLQRQQEILSRLLDAARSNRERDFDKERESHSGVDVMRPSPPDVKLSDDSKMPAQQDLLDSREQGYTKDYEGLIRRYFEALGK